MNDKSTIEDVISAMKKIHKQKPEVYCGKGEFSRMTITFHPGISQESLDALIVPFQLVLPDSYRTLLTFSNGIYFFEYADHQIFSIQEALKLSLIGEGKEDLAKKKLLRIGTCLEDFIYMKCDGSERNIYVSEEGISDPYPVHMSFLAFLEAGLISSFSYFWLWGTEHYDLY